jgi:hypothetical protein
MEAKNTDKIDALRFGLSSTWNLHVQVALIVKGPHFVTLPCYGAINRI